MSFRSCVLALFVALSAQARAASNPAEDAYLAARTAYRDLKADPARRALRHNWLNVAKKYSAMKLKYPSCARAPEALFTSSQLMDELSQISRLEEDVSLAVENYQRFLARHPNHRLADDAALALARIYADRRGRPEEARKVLSRA